MKAENYPLSRRERVGVRGAFFLLSLLPLTLACQRPAEKPAASTSDPYTTKLQPLIEDFRPQAGDPRPRDRRRRRRPRRLRAGLRRPVPQPQERPRHAALALPHGVDHQALRRDRRHAARREGQHAARRADHDVPALLRDGRPAREDDHDPAAAHAHLRHARRRRLRVGQAAVRRRRPRALRPEPHGSEAHLRARRALPVQQHRLTRSWATPWRRPRA